MLAPCAPRTLVHSGSRLPDGSFRVVGFSLGAPVALRLAADHPDRVAELVLVSAAAPLASGNFLPDMAGAPVFRLARKSKAGLGALLAAQGMAARLAPDALLAALSKGTCEAERDWLARPGVTPALARSLRESYGPRRADSVRRLRDYARSTDPVPDIRAPVRILHGTEDTWTPPAMASALADALGAEVEWQDGLGHYTTLARTLPDLVAGATRRT